MEVVAVPFVVGEQVGAYRIVEQLGQGGMSTVYKAYHASLDRYVALKVLHPVFKGDQGFLQRFQREARIVARLEHPHIVPVYDFSEHEGTPYLVMRYVEGHTLKALLSEARSLPLGRILEILRPVCDALAYAHGQGVLHRDIKPSNILISQEDKIYVTDFGLAKMAQTGDSTISHDRMIGTPQYISPEQAKGEPLDRRTDLYSLGVILFEMVTGRVPYTADTPFAVVHDHIFSPLPLPSRLNPAVPPAVEQVVLKALAKSPDDRFQSAAEFFRALEEVARRLQGEAPGPAAVVAPSLAAGRESPPSTVSFEVGPAVEEAPPAAETGAGVTVVAPGVVPVKPRRRRGKRPWWVLALVGGLLIVALVFVLAVWPPLARRRAERTLLSAVARHIVKDISRFAPTAGLRPDLPLTLPEDIVRGGQRMPLEEAQRILEGVEGQIVRNRGDPVLHLERGNALFDLGRWPEAEGAYLDALRLDPEMAPAHLGLGATLLAQKELPQAIEHLQRTLQLRPPKDLLESAYYNLGIAYALSRDRPQAIGALEMFLQLQPDREILRQKAKDLLEYLREP